MPTEYELRPRTTKADWQEVKTENPIAKQMQAAQRQAEQTLLGYRRAVYFCGPPGIGKSHVLDCAIRNAGVRPKRARPRNSRELVDLFRTSTRDTPIVLEECDHLFSSEPCLNLLKLATEKHGQSIQVYVGARSARARGTWETVQLTAPVTFTLNNCLTDLTVWPKECRNHIEALCSREPPLTITADRAAQWEYAIYLATVEQMLRYTEGTDRPNPLDIQNAAIRWLTENVWRLSEVSPRRLTKIMRTMMMHHRTGYRWGRGALTEELEQFLDASLTDTRPVPTAPQILLNSSPQFPISGGVMKELRVSDAASANTSRNGGHFIPRAMKECATFDGRVR